MKRNFSAVASYIPDLYQVDLRRRRRGNGSRDYNFDTLE